ncbi:HlyD family type I secretion periplasmic adaptor subunit [Pseudomonas fontis]|uniref:Membrane fusion protein (MFP) family protein n=1 Tax=Pseudomonas fontis TaxID=2942633 RepID=A0ABT5NUE5_9PSED|nr:HlyD family type I secretion periplasmic adaptor subunit [Pseudomonas fontis]MDD0973948.1 HlyD family type I secretion periplasmic adaptor subunit [Pseudomonas fontis]MDD0991790.1 HlyD family type I secretion periplasmic adaptor subunit [Pseudomonas fontis]
MSGTGAGRELLSRYRQVWRHAWAQRKAMTPVRRLAHEVQFLPAALALQEQPVHPAPRYISWTIMLFLALALVWACIGEIDVVATATGKIIPSGKTKIIQPSEVAVVKAIHVRDGQQVRAGDVLVELDANITAADVERLGSDLLAARVDSARAEVFLEAIQNDAEPGPLALLIADAPVAQQVAAQRWVQSQYQELRATLDQGDAQIEQQMAEIQAARASVASLKESLPIARQLSADYRRLYDRAIVGKHFWMEKEQSRMAQERELLVQQARVQELLASKKEVERRQAGVIAQTRRTLLDLLHEADQQVAALSQELKKAEQRNRLTRLTAPVDGTVQQLAIHTEGGVVTEAQPLMAIVPLNQPVEVEAMLENKDIGFVRPGQAVEIKVETFNFTKYGVLHGTVESVSNDAIEDERRGPLYSVRIFLKDTHVRVGDTQVALSPGMTVRAEVKTDKRKVIEYFLSPLERYVDESLSER